MIGLALAAFIFASLGFASGVVASAYVPSLPVAGRRVMSATATYALGRVRKSAVRPHEPNIPIMTETVTAGSGSGKPIGIATAGANLARALAKVLAFALKHPVFALGLALVAFWLLSGVKLPFAGKSKGELRLEARIAHSEARMLEAINARDVEIAEAAARTAVRRAQIVLLSEQGRTEIEAVRPADETPIDPGVERAWRDALERLRIYPSSDAARADSSEPGA